jgi:hypothetical protein
MGSVHGFSAVHNAHEPCGLALDHAPALALPSGSKSKSKSKSRRRFMGSVHGLSSVHNGLEPTGTFNVQRSTFNVQRSTLRFNVQPVHGKQKKRPATGNKLFLVPH